MTLPDDERASWKINANPPKEVVSDAKNEFDEYEQPSQGQIKDKILERLVDIKLNLD